jgi:hypothetical protein
MKKIIFYVLPVCFLIAGLTACIKNDLPTFTDRVAEIDATTWNANGVGVTYPFITRVPAFNRALGTTAPSGPDSTLRRWSGTIRVRVNLVGPVSGKDETVGYSIFNSPVTTVSFPATLTAAQLPPSGQTPAQPANAALPVLNAVAGTHYAALSGTVTIPKDSSFGYITVQILNPGSANEARFLGIQLNNNGSIKASVNYSQVALFIDQR